MLGFFEKHTDTALTREVERVLARAHDGVLPITQAGEPVLRQQAVAYKGQLPQRVLMKLIAAMRETMLDAPGVGLAAPQIGLSLALAVVEDHVEEDAGAHDAADNADSTVNSEHSAHNNAHNIHSADDSDDTDDVDDASLYDEDPREFAEFPFHVIINPSYVPVGEQTRSFYEGCLSVSGYQAVRRRWLDIIARWHDETGRPHEKRLHGWPARIFQHETDHLRGELYIDKAQIRSLTTDDNLAERYAEDPVPQEAARLLGFEL